MKRKLQTMGWLTALLGMVLLWVSPAMATDYKLYIAGTQVTDANCNNLKDIEGVTVAEGGEFKYDPATKTLTMKEVTVSVGDRKNAIWNGDIEGLKIDVSGTNSLKATDVNNSTLLCFASTEIGGNGRLTVTNDNSAGVSVTGTTLTISDITLEASGEWGITGDSWSAEDEILILKNATVNATGRLAGIANFSTLTTENCEIVVPEGGHFDKAKHAVVDADGNKAKEVKIEPPIELYIAGTQVTNANCNNLKDIEGVTVAEGGVFQYDPATKTLTMKEVTVTVGEGENAIKNSGIEGLKIDVTGTNRLETKDNNSALLCFASTEIGGNGHLTVTSNGSAGVFVNGTTLTIYDITLEASGEFGIKGDSWTPKYGTLILKNATVNATSRLGGIIDFVALTTENCKIVVPEGGKFDKAKHAVVDADGNKAKEVKIEPPIELYIAGTQVTNANCNNLKDIEGVTVGTDGEFKYDPATKTLTMKEVTVTVGEGKNAIKNSGVEELKINVSGTNSLEATNWSTLDCSASTELEGNGSLTIGGSNSIAVYVKDMLTISDITLVASSRYGIAGSSGISGESLILKNAKVTAKGTEAGIANLASLTTEGCKIISPAGGKFDLNKHAVVDAEGDEAKEVEIEPIIELYIAGTQVTSANCNDLKDIEGVTVAEGGEFKYDHATKTLTMKEVTVSVGDNKDAISNQGVEGLKIDVSGTNSLEATNWSTLDCSASTELKGNGSLTIDGSNSIAVYVKKMLTISDITLVASSRLGIAGENGIDGETLILKNAKVTAKGTEAGIANLASFTTENCKIISPAGGKFDEAKHAVVDAEENIAKEVKIGKEAESVTVTGVTVTPTTAELKVGETKQLSITVEPTTATNKNYTCESDKESVATVDNTGLITAVGVGTATITVTTEDGGHTATCSLTVTAGDVPLTGLKVNPSETHIAVEQTLSLNVSYEPASTTHKGVKWATSDAAIVTVDQSGIIKGIAVGEAIITAKSKEDETIKGTCRVIVDSATAIEDAAFTNVLVAPNPFDNQLRIVNGELRGTYALLNAQGVVVRAGNMVGSEVVIETSDLTSGLYLLRLTATNGATKVVTVVKE